MAIERDQRLVAAIQAVEKYGWDSDLIPAGTRVTVWEGKFPVRIWHAWELHRDGGPVDTKPYEELK